MMERITISPNIHFGKPCIAGTRIPVQSVLELVRDGIPFDRIIQDYYPDLNMEDIRACIERTFRRRAEAGIRCRRAWKT